jgi:serine/threonine protein kinase
MTIYWQRLKICVRLFRIIILLIFKKKLYPTKCWRIKRKGNGLSSTFIVGEKYAVKIRNEIASANNKKIYDGKFDGLFFYDDDNKRRRKEYYLFLALHTLGISARPVLFTNDTLVTEYIPAISLAETFGSLSPKLIDKIFSLVDRIHQAGIFHGDLNLSNLLLKDDCLYIIDFESSRYIETGMEEKLFCLDIIIFIEKLHRFHPRIFFSSVSLLRSKIEMLRTSYISLPKACARYLSKDVYDEIF